MSKFLVEIKQNLTACDTIFRGQSTQRTLSQNLFETETEAEKFYLSEKSSLKFAGLAGQYVTFPVRVDDDFKIYEKFCDHCNAGIESENYTDLDGDFCSKTCFRNNYQAENFSEEEQYYDDY